MLIDFKEGEREREKKEHQLVASCMRKQPNPVPAQRSNPHPFGAPEGAQPTEPSSQGASSF